MSRNTRQINSYVGIAYGEDHAVGKFIQVFDKRTKSKIEEGCVFDFDELFGFANCTNFIELTKTDIDKIISNIYSLDNDGRISQRCLDFINSEKFEQMSLLDEENF